MDFINLFVLWIKPNTLESYHTPETLYGSNNVERHHKNKIKKHQNFKCDTMNSWISNL